MEIKTYTVQYQEVFGIFQIVMLIHKHSFIKRLVCNISLTYHLQLQTLFLLQKPLLCPRTRQSDVHETPPAIGHAAPPCGAEVII